MTAGTTPPPTASSAACHGQTSCRIRSRFCRCQAWSSSYEAVHSHRQIFADGRPFPADMNPTWFGYSVGKWEKDAFVVETKGFNDKGWLDNFGKPATDKLRVVERFVRKDFGHMDVHITIDDPGAHQAVGRDAAARARPGHGAAGIHLQREQQLLRDHPKAGTEVAGMRGPCASRAGREESRCAL